MTDHDHAGPDYACPACKPLADVLRDRMKWPSMHWGELHPDAYPSLARAVHKAGYGLLAPLIDRAERAEAERPSIKEREPCGMPYPGHPERLCVKPKGHDTHMRPGDAWCTDEDAWTELIAERDALAAKLEAVQSFIETWSQPHSCKENNTAKCVPCRMLADLRAAVQSVQETDQ